MTWRLALSTVYPEAAELPVIAVRTREILAGRGFTRDNTLFANATCRDELMRGAVDLFAAMWGENFDLAGLGGYPSAGVTGFRAYASHAPDGGNLLVFYGPHVGVSEKGALGVARRPGMECESDSCGAVLTVLHKLAANRHQAASPDPLDAEQVALESDLAPMAARFLGAVDQIMAVTECAYEVIDRRLSEIVSASGYEGTVALLGGITVNAPSSAHDLFVPRRFEVGRLNVQPTVLLDGLLA